MTSPSRPAADARQREENKRIVLAFYEQGLLRRDFAAARQYLGPRYIQHNPLVADGQEGFEIFLQFLRTHYSGSRSEIKRVFVDGDHVILHVHVVRGPDDPGLAIVDIFRLENGKIVEHWDVVQEIPAHAANPNGMI
jgi:predicted SnoaL-like aldol condensation-catalyzing enzyme